jgi:DNA adenine methylase
MQYFGGKQRTAAKLAAFMHPYVAHRGAYIEPFVGGAAMMAAQPAPVRVGGDANVALITMWRALADGWTPPQHITEDEYANVKRRQDPSDPLTAFVGFGASFAGKWFGGYARGGEGRNYAANAASSLQKKAHGLRGVRWHSGDYRTCPLPSRAVIYCDPPYAGTTQYGAVGAFSWIDFWAWCLIKHAEGFAVFVSEYAAPPSFRIAYEVATKTDIRTNAAGKEPRIERLFVPADADYGC